MKLIYTNENRLLVGNARNIVESAGIEVVLKNEYAAGGTGELSPLDTWPELWVVRDSDYGKAVGLLENVLAPRNAEEWRCSYCSELNDASFEVCWKCQKDSPG